MASEQGLVESKIGLSNSPASHGEVLEPRRLSELGTADFGWLKTRHHFALGVVGNPTHRSVGNLIAWADDEIAPRTGFPIHPHASVEIITYVRDGAVTHQDSLGNKGRTIAGDVQ